MIEHKLLVIVQHCISFLSQLQARDKNENLSISQRSEIFLLHLTFLSTSILKWWLLRWPYCNAFRDCSQQIWSKGGMSEDRKITLPTFLNSLSCCKCAYDALKHFHCVIRTLDTIELVSNAERYAFRQKKSTHIRSAWKRHLNRQLKRIKWVSSRLENCLMAFIAVLKWESALHFRIRDRNTERQAFAINLLWEHH